MAITTDTRSTTTKKITPPKNIEHLIWCILSQRQQYGTQKVIQSLIQCGAISILSPGLSRSGDLNYLGEEKFQKI